MTAEQLTTVSTPACVVSEPTTTNTNTAQYAASSSSSAKYPKKRVAILFGYNGEKYHGLQFSKDVPTVEQELVNALAKVGLVLESNSTDPFKMSMNRCARTDKGVHAVRQVVSLKIMFPPNLKVNDMPAFINTALPEHVRVWSVVKTVGSFDSKTQCTSRRYEYILPTYTLGSPHPLSMFHPQNAKFVEETGTRANPLKFPIIEEIGKMGKNKEELVAYRATPNQLSKLRSIVEAYKGRHNFHNFTIGKSFKEAYCHRYILEASMSEPFYVDGMEWVRVLFHGQSFMLHQIRKMIGFAILAIRADVDASQVLPELFGPTPVNIPKAPALGLLLDEPLFAIYNSDATVEERMELAIKKKEENDAKWAVKLAARREADTANEGATPTPNTASASSSSTENAVIWDSSNKDHGECQADEGVQVTPPSPAVTTADSSSAQVKVEELDGSSSSGSVIEDAQPDSTEVADHVEIKHEDKLKKEEQMESTSSPNKNNKDNSKNNSNNKGGKRKADKEIRIFESKRIKLGLEKIEFGNKELIEAFKLKHIHEFIVKKEHELNDFFGWINFCDKHSYFFIPFLNSKNLVREMHISTGGLNKSDL